MIAGRPRDLEDVRSILLKNREFDLAYIEHWLEEYDREIGEGYAAKFAELWKTIEASMSKARGDSQ